jgi:hypothetical protein
VNVKNWNLITLQYNDSYYPAGKSFNYSGTLTPSQSAPGTTAEFYFNRYFECKFQLPSTATALIVYRRSFTPATQFTTNFSNQGPWERVRIPVADFDGPDLEGWSLVRLRGPLANPATNSPQGDFDFPSSSDTNKITGVRTYAGGFGNYQNGQRHEFLLVIEDANVELNRALFLTDFSFSFLVVLSLSHNTLNGLINNTSGVGITILFSILKMSII